MDTFDEWAQFIHESEAIAAIWRCGDDCNYFRYNGKIYTIRGNFASKESFIAEEKAKYTMEDTLYVKNEHVYRKTVLGGMSELNNILEKMLLMRLLSRIMYQMKYVYNLKILFTILLSSY